MVGKGGGSGPHPLVLHQIHSLHEIFCEENFPEILEVKAAGIFLEKTIVNIMKIKCNA